MAKGVCTPDSALELLERAVRHYHKSTQTRIAMNCQVVLDGVLAQEDSDSAELYRAFLLPKLEPNSLKS